LPETVIRSYKKSLKKLFDFLLYKNWLDNEDLIKDIINRNKKENITKTIEAIISSSAKKSNFLNINQTFEINKITTF
jgi:TRAP-type mannitol/chloroaromatic compound transport system substrate-binding protein